jgi:hypothetical protein
LPIRQARPLAALACCRFLPSFATPSLLLP